MDGLKVVRTSGTNYEMESYTDTNYLALSKMGAGLTNATQLYTNNTTGDIQYTATNGTARADLVACLNFQNQR